LSEAQDVRKKEPCPRFIVQLILAEFAELAELIDSNFGNLYSSFEFIPADEKGNQRNYPQGHQERQHRLLTRASRPCCAK
jgi:hypothetical protein